MSTTAHSEAPARPSARDRHDERRRALADSALDPSLLTLEIAESVIMRDADAGSMHLRALKGLGVRLAIDDFGNGYSSLGYLQRFPVEAVKIDRSFVAGLGHDDHDTTIVTAVIDLGHALDLLVVGEGVESPEQLGLLRRLGCDAVQGFLLDPPLDAAAARRRIEVDRPGRIRR